MPIAFSGIPEMLGGYVHRFVRASEPAIRRPVGPWDAPRVLDQRLDFDRLLIGFCLALALASSYTDAGAGVARVVLGVMVACVSACCGGRASARICWRCSDRHVPPAGRHDFPDFVLPAGVCPGVRGTQAPGWKSPLYLSAVGGGAYDYIGYVGMLREKKWGLAGSDIASRDKLSEAVSDGRHAEETIRRARLWARAPLFDTSLSFFLVILVTLLFGVMGTLVLHNESVIPANNDLLNEQERFLTVLHPELCWLYRTGVFLAFIGTLYGAFEVYRQTFTESAVAVFPAWNTPERVRILRGVTVAYCTVSGLVIRCGCRSKSRGVSSNALRSAAS